MLRFSYELKGDSFTPGTDSGEDLRWLEQPNITRTNGVREKI